MPIYIEVVFSYENKVEVEVVFPYENKVEVLYMKTRKTTKTFFFF